MTYGFLFLLPSSPLVLSIVFCNFFPFFVMRFTKIDTFVRIDNQICRHTCFATAHRPLGRLLATLNATIHSFLHPTHVRPEEPTQI